MIFYSKYKDYQDEIVDKLEADGLVSKPIGITEKSSCVKIRDIHPNEEIDAITITCPDKHKITICNTYPIHIDLLDDKGEDIHPRTIIRVHNDNINYRRVCYQDISLGINMSKNIILNAGDAIAITVYHYKGSNADCRNPVNISAENIKLYLEADIWTKI